MFPPIFHYWHVVIVTDVPVNHLGDCVMSLFVISLSNLLAPAGVYVLPLGPWNHLMIAADGLLHKITVNKIAIAFLFHLLSPLPS